MPFQTFSGADYLRMDIASNFGLDKKTWNERLAWFQAHEADLESKLEEADEPALYFAGVQAYREMQKGKPIGYPISLDATSSGIQILAALTGDRQAAELCNVVPYQDQRMDAYTAIYQAMTAQLGDTAKIERDQVKKAIMTSTYGSTAMPKEVFGDGPLLTCFHDTMEAMAPGVWELNKAMLAIWDPTALRHDWTMPDNFHVGVKVMSQTSETVHFLNEPFHVLRKVNTPMENGRSLGANMTHSIDGMIVREMTRRCSYDPDRIDRLKHMIEVDWDNKETETEDDQMVITLWNHYQQSGYLSARILDHLMVNNIGHVDKAVIKELLGSLPEKPFKILSIHDCFRCLPHYGNDLRRQYTRQLYLIARSNLLSFLLSQIMKKPVNIGKIDPTMANHILESNYSLS